MLFAKVSMHAFYQGTHASFCRCTHAFCLIVHHQGSTGVVAGVAGSGFRNISGAPGMGQAVLGQWDILEFSIEVSGPFWLLGTGARHQGLDYFGSPFCWELLARG